MAAEALDVVTIGRVSVDLYGQQIGGRLEDMASFAKSVGGSPANMAIGAARLGLKAGFVSRVGEEAMGRFIREQMQREGVDTRGLKTDPVRLTGLVLLGVRDEHNFPLIFYRENCADSALDEGDIDEAYIASARAVVVTGTHFALANTDAAQRKAMRIARAHGRKVVLDIDYRPNLWGLAGHDAGSSRYIASGRVSEHLQNLLPMCDLIVGTEEELRIAGGAGDTLEALRAVRRLSTATIVLKRGPMGSVVYEGAIPSEIGDGIVGEGFPVEVYNVLGAGDAFMAGFLSGWLRDQPLAECARRANACGAIAVSRLLCSPEYPTAVELEHFLNSGSTTRALRHDPALTHLHRVTTRRPLATPFVALDIAGCLGLAEDAERLGELLLDAVTQLASGRAAIGVLLDQRCPAAVLHRATGLPIAVLRRPAKAECDTDLIEWPVRQTVLLESEEMGQASLAELGRSAHRLGHEVAVVVSRRNGAPDYLRDIYEADLMPDWWVVSGIKDLAPLRETIAQLDPHSRGLLTLDGDPPIEGANGAIVGTASLGPIVRRWVEHDRNDAPLVRAIVDGIAAYVAAWTSAP